MIAALELPGGLLPGLAVAFLAGAVSFLSPCVLPLVPSYLSLMSGVSATQLASAKRVDQRRLLRASVLFVLGYTVVFVAFGATASAIGQTLVRNNRTFEKVAAILIIVMGLVLAGVVNIPLLQREARFHASTRALGEWAPPVMGAAFAFGWSPCIGPVLGAILGLAANSGSLGRGTLLLVSYSVGLGVPFVAAGVAFGRLTGAFAWVKRHTRIINLVAGLGLALLGVLLLTGWLTSYVIPWLQDVGNAVGLDFLENSL